MAIWRSGPQQIFLVLGRVPGMQGQTQCTLTSLVLIPVVLPASTSWSVARSLPSDLLVLFRTFPRRFVLPSLLLCSSRTWARSLLPLCSLVLVGLTWYRVLLAIFDLCKGSLSSSLSTSRVSLSPASRTRSDWDNLWGNHRRCVRWSTWR